MASTTAPIVWEFYRQVNDAQNLVGVSHFYDGDSQSLYLSANAIKTNVATIVEGHWSTATPKPAIKITDSTFSNMRLDHPSNGVLYGSATDGTALTYLRYIYAMDISPYTDSWDWTTQIDNNVAQLSASVQNLGPDIFGYDSTLFQPGARMTLGFRIGGSEVYPIGVAWLDECTYDIAGETVDISGRNTTGYFLRDQTFDDNTVHKGVSSTLMANIFNYAGVTKYSIQPGDGTLGFKFAPTDSLLDGIQAMLSAYSTPAMEWKMVELPDGTIIVGYDHWIAGFVKNTHYSFDEGADVFKRRTTKLVDSSFTAIRATGLDADDKELTPVTVPISNFKYWALGPHRTRHLRAPDGLTQEYLQLWAEVQASLYQYVGIGEEFTGPFRPQLLIGDIAEVVNDNEGTSLGIVTEVRHTFSKRDGYKTEFSVDSGGIATDGENYTVYSRAAAVSGFNRRQRVTDLVRLLVKK